MIGDGSPPDHWYNPPEGREHPDKHPDCGYCHEEFHNYEKDQDWCGLCEVYMERAIKNGDYCPEHKAWYCEKEHGEKAA